MGKSKTKGLRPRVQKTETNSNSKEVTVNHRVVTEAVTNSNKVTSRDTTLDTVDMVPRAVITSKVTVHTTNSKVTIPINNKDNNKVTLNNNPDMEATTRVHTTNSSKVTASSSNKDRTDSKGTSNKRRQTGVTDSRQQPNKEDNNKVLWEIMVSKTTLLTVQ